MNAVRVVLCATFTLLASTTFAGPSVVTVYDAVPTPLPPSVSSLGFEATGASEFGDYIHLTSDKRRVKAITVTMVDWAVYADYASDVRYAGNHLTWKHPITLNVYKAGVLDAFGAPTTRLASVTRWVDIPWRPAVWNYSGIAFNVTFELEKRLPADVIVSVAFDTQHYGETPVGVAGPYNSLNVGVPEGQTAAKGTDDDVDAVFWNTSQPYYADEGVLGYFREDTLWAPYGTVAIRVTAKGGRDDDDDDDDHHDDHDDESGHGDKDRDRGSGKGGRGRDR